MFAIEVFDPTNRLQTRYRRTAKGSLQAMLNLAEYARGLHPDLLVRIVAI